MKRYYTESCGEILNFVAVAVASGLIGNMSYDIVKKVFGKIVSYLKRSKKNKECDYGRGICGSCFSYHRRSDKNEV